MPEPSLAIFRKRLLSYSETFIADQGQLLPGYRPVYCGFERDSSGIGLIEDSDRLLLSDYSTVMPLAKLMFRNRLGGGGAWIRAIAQRNPALVHAHFFNDGIDATRISDRLQIPVVTTVHGHDITKHQNTGAQQDVCRDFFDRVECVIAVSDFIAASSSPTG